MEIKLHFLLLAIDDDTLPFGFFRNFAFFFLIELGFMNNKDNIFINNHKPNRIGFKNVLLLLPIFVQKSHRLFFRFGF